MKTCVNSIARVGTFPGVAKMRHRGRFCPYPKCDARDGSARTQDVTPGTVLPVHKMRHRGRFCPYHKCAGQNRPYWRINAPARTVPTSALNAPARTVPALALIIMH